jgi:hypothetical protein
MCERLFNVIPIKSEINVRKLLFSRTTLPNEFQFSSNESIFDTFIFILRGGGFKRNNGTSSLTSSKCFWRTTFLITFKPGLWIVYFHLNIPGKIIRSAVSTAQDTTWQQNDKWQWFSSLPAYHPTPEALFYLDHSNELTGNRVMQIYL